MSEVKKILIIGPFSPPVTGLSKANDVLYHGLKSFNSNKVARINTEYSKDLGSEQGKFSITKLGFLMFYLRIYKIIFYKNIYITTGQTFFGVIKYLPFVVLAKILNKTTFIHLHGNALSDNYYKLRGFKKRLFKLTISLYNRGIVLSDSLKKNFEPFLKRENILVEHNFVSDSFKNDLTKNDFSSLKIAFMSNLYREKGINNLVDALSVMEEGGVYFQCKVAGSVPKGNQSIITKMKKIKNLEYLGHVESDEKEALLNWSNVFCLPTQLPEGQPISILEAMYFENYIVATNTPGIADIVSEENGTLLNSYDSLTIAETLENINLGEIKEIGQENRKIIISDYSESGFVNRINLLF